jgi:hypothetical protein
VGKSGLPSWVTHESSQVTSGLNQTNIPPFCLCFSMWVLHFQGGREYMEDRMAFAGRLQGRGGASYYAVFDGHGGALAAECVLLLVYVHVGGLTCPK